MDRQTELTAFDVMRLENAGMNNVRILNAGGAHISQALLGKIYSDCQFQFARPGRILVVRFRSHPLQIELLAATGVKMDEADGQRMSAFGAAWTADGTLALDVVLIESVDGVSVLGRLENLYPSCPTCLEVRLENALRAEGLLKARAPRTLIQCEGKPVSETLIEDRG